MSLLLHRSAQFLTTTTTDWVRLKNTQIINAHFQTGDARRAVFQRVHMCVFVFVLSQSHGLEGMKIKSDNKKTVGFVV